MIPHRLRKGKLGRNVYVGFRRAGSMSTSQLFIPLPADAYPSASRNMEAVNGNHDAGSPFESFFGRWLLDQEEYLRQLLQHRDRGQQQEEEEIQTLLSRVLRHYESYYEEKSRCARVDATQFFSPPWLTALEKTWLWIGGWKPLLAFRVVANSAGPLMSQEQRAWMERERAETRRREAELSEELAKVQESLGSPAVLEQARMVLGRARDGERRELEEVMESLHRSMGALLKEADLLRVSTVRKILEILQSPSQTLDFLAAAAQLHLWIRTKGLQRQPSAH